MADSEIKKLKEEIEKIKQTLKEHEEWIRDIENMLGEPAGEAGAGFGKSPFEEKEKGLQRQAPSFVKGKSEKK
jgi:wobble nucleotide-excising tRNase